MPRRRFQPGLIRLACELSLALALILPCACAGPESATKPTEWKPVALSPDLAGLAVRIHADGTDIGREAASALGTELARAGLTVLSDAQRPSDLDLRLAVDLRSIGIAVEGVTTLSAESGGVLLDRFTTPLDVYRRDTFAASVARQLADAFAKSARVRTSAAGRRVASADVGAGPPAATTAPEAAPPAPQPALVAGQPAAPAPPAAPAAVAAPAPAPAAPVTPPPAPSASPPTPSPAPAASPAPQTAVAPALGRSGRFGLGLALEAELGWAQAISSETSVPGAVVALALQFDLGPRAAFRLPLSFAFAGSGSDLFGQLALSPTLIYRFREHPDQEWVPYLGLGLRLGSGLGGRHLLGRPVMAAGVKGPDSCPDSIEHPRDSSQPVPDCSMFISPEPVVGVEWHSSRLFSIDIAASYSFAHFSSSEGLARWVSLLQVYLGPRVSF